MKGACDVRSGSRDSGSIPGGAAGQGRAAACLHRRRAAGTGGMFLRALDAGWTDDGGSVLFVCRHPVGGYWIGRRSIGERAEQGLYGPGIDGDH